MTINAFLNQHIEQLQDIIIALPDEFASHHVIQKIAQHYEREYIDFLYHYRQPVGERGAFREVHRQIARFLQSNHHTLHIEKTTRVDTQNVFGDASENQGWRKAVVQIVREPPN